ncbi:hypothetical protein NE237_026030 [Protea cynaroides]|uniref:Uncharacterized protein n=1 Tax=Protea cynaroides TaxID=273540 RepID=A0A9Q0H483_9MAGN|nr:hypothetical protein NE237_026030 [Protea cynaroides]
MAPKYGGGSNITTSTFGIKESRGFLEKAVEEESSRGTLLACIIKQQYQATEVVVESNSCMQQQDNPVQLDDEDKTDGNRTMVKRQRVSVVQVVELSDDDKVPGDDKSVALKRWRDANYFSPDFKIKVLFMFKRSSIMLMLQSSHLNQEILMRRQ